MAIKWNPYAQAYVDTKTNRIVDAPSTSSRRSRGGGKTYTAPVTLPHPSIAFGTTPAAVQAGNYLVSQGLASPRPGGGVIYNAPSGGSSRTAAQTVPTTATGGQVYNRGQVYSAQDLAKAVRQVLTEMGIGRGPTIEDIRNIVSEFASTLRPPSPPPIDFEAASQTIMQGINPLVQAGLEALGRQFDEAASRLLAQQAQAGVTGDPAAAALRDLAEARARAVSELQAQTAATVIPQALALIGAQQARFANQQQANQEALRLATSMFGALTGAQNQRAAQMIQSLLAAYQLQEQARQANLPYEAIQPTTLLSQLLWLLAANPAAFQQLLAKAGG